MKYLMCLILLFSSFSLLSQDYPKYMKIDDSVRVVFTIEQAKKIDWNLELLQLYKLKGVNCDSVIKSNIDMQTKYESKIAIMNNKIEALIELDKLNTINSSKKDSLITNYGCDLHKANDQISKLNSIIKNKNKIIVRSNIGKYLGYAGTIVFGLTAFILATN